jgi:hypothetical protein
VVVSSPIHGLGSPQVCCAAARTRFSAPGGRGSLISRQGRTEGESSRRRPSQPPRPHAGRWVVQMHERARTSGSASAQSLGLGGGRRTGSQCIGRSDPWSTPPALVGCSQALTSCRRRICVPPARDPRRHCVSELPKKGIHRPQGRARLRTGWGGGPPCCATAVRLAAPALAPTHGFCTLACPHAQRGTSSRGPMARNRPGPAPTGRALPLAPGPQVPGSSQPRRCSRRAAPLCGRTRLQHPVAGAGAVAATASRAQGVAFYPAAQSYKVISTHLPRQRVLWRGPPAVARHWAGAGARPGAGRRRCAPAADAAAAAACIAGAVAGAAAAAAALPSHVRQPALDSKPKEVTDDLGCQDSGVGQHGKTAERARTASSHVARPLPCLPLR